MKHTSVDNPDIKIWDERLIKIAQVVKEVKESEEWEEVKMGVMSVVMERGMEIGEEHGEMKKRVSLTLRKMRRNISPEETADMLETDVEVIRRIYEVAKRFAPDYDERKVSTELLREMKK